MKLAIITADARRAYLHRCEGERDGRWRIERTATLENPWEDYHEHGRPSLLGRGPTANAAQHFASRGHEQEEEEARFARDIRNWVTHGIGGRESKHAIIFAPPRMLGHLREQLQGQADVELLEAELTPLTPAELERHPAVQSALQATAD